MSGWNRGCSYCFIGVLLWTRRKVMCEYLEGVEIEGGFLKIVDIEVCLYIDGCIWEKRRD